jgi:hypothetical protein
VSDAPAQTVPAPAATKAAAEERLAYRLITGPDDRSFCERISTALAEGYVLHGSPAATYNGINVIVAQALVLPTAIATADAAVATAVDQLDANEGNDEFAEEAFEGHA